jgi:hypothetical protein
MEVPDFSPQRTPRTPEKQPENFDRIHRIIQDLLDFDPIRVHLCPFVVQGFKLEH